WASLRAVGAEIVETEAFADHHVFSAVELDNLRKTAAHAGASLVTTQKDAARLGRAGLGIATLPVALAFDDPSGVDAALGRALASTSTI
ncbi:MAG: tetraacyldisaccharide 4'-kinase, partial [Hyphomicrobiales bacterium]|nr:tetraacyldisaccharide 4'-kinase [Hyphomicrobiales bacterium]